MAINQERELVMLTNIRASLESLNIMLQSIGMLGFNTSFQDLFIRSECDLSTYEHNFERAAAINEKWADFFQTAARVPEFVRSIAEAQQVMEVEPEALRVRK